MADDAAALLDELKVREPVVVGGLSMGGYVALAFARRHAGRLRALILADTRRGPDDAAGRANRDKMIEFASKNPATAVVEQMLPKMLSRKPCRNDRKSSTPSSISHRFSLRRPSSTPLKALRDRPDAAPFLRQIAVPTLVLVGREDALTPPATAENLTAGIPGAKMFVIEKAGHLSNLEQPEGFNQAVRTFLATL